MNIQEIHLFEGVSNATLTTYIQDMPIGDQISDRPAVIICPGGAYIGITEKEAEPVALRFLSAGYQVFVLRYSIGAGMARFPAPFIDAAKALMLVRENAVQWGIDPDKVALCGFSTGGHVAAVLAASWQEDYLSKALNAENKLFKPNALILGYPLLDMDQFRRKNLKRSPDMQPLIEMMDSAVYGTLNPSKQPMDEWNIPTKVTSHMPPTFLWMTAEDAFIDVEEGLDLIKALAANCIPYEVHIFEKGAHGLSLGEPDAKGHGNAHKWVGLALNWLKDIK